MTDRLLSGEWEIGSVPPAPFGRRDDLDHVAEWLPATVPGDVRLALLAAGRIPDPLYGANAEESRWVDGVDWWYRRSFGAVPGTRSFLVFEGVDYLSAVYLNGQVLGFHEGMFSPQVYDVTTLLREENQLAVRVWGAHAYRRYPLGPKERLWQWAGKRLFGGDLFPDRLATLKCQMSFGWDFAPRLPAMGIWEDVHLWQGGAVRIAGLFPRLEGREGGATVGLRVELDAAEALRAELTVELEGPNFATAAQSFAFPLQVAPGLSRHEVAVQPAAPRLWQPWDRGEPNLYRLRVSIRQGEEVLDAVEQVTGLRQVMLGETGASGERGALSLVVNGEPVFIRGANWVPADALYARLGPADYAALIGLAKEANVNLLRVWGGGLREKRAFYDACDAAGILVWQEFPLACAFLDYLPRSEEYLNLVRQETREIVRAVRHHPAVVLWCGGNEFNPRRNRAIVEAMRENVAAEDGSRPFRPASPAGGDHHNWRVWHGKANVRDYQKDRAVLASEFGLQAAPSLESLRRFLPTGSVLPPGDGWEYHCAQLEKLRRYAAPYAPKTDEEFVLATQRAQAQGLQVAIEHFRRQKGRCSGVIFWQFNEPWGAISWSVVDYYRQPKLAYHKVKQLYNPVLISIAYPLRRYRPGDHWQGAIHALNDAPEAHQDCLLIVRYGGEKRYERRIALPGDRAAVVDEIDFVLEELGCLEVELWEGERLLAQNDYDLAYYDPGEILRWDTVRDWLTWRALG